MNATGVLAVDGGDCDAVLADFAHAGVDEAALADRLEREGTEAFTTSWKDLLERLAAKRAALGPRAAAERP